MAAFHQCDVEGGALMTRLDLSQFDGAFPGPYRVEGRRIRAITHGEWHTLASCDTRGWMTGAAEDQHAAFFAAAPALVAALRDAYAEIDRLRALANRLTNHLGDAINVPKFVCSKALHIEARAALAEGDTP
jgi:hypothetical protein